MHDSEKIPTKILSSIIIIFILMCYGFFCFNIAKSSFAPLNLIAGVLLFFLPQFLLLNFIYLTKKK